MYKKGARTNQLHTYVHLILREEQNNENVETLNLYLCVVKHVNYKTYI
jgi:hypothetical protein